MRGVIAAGLLLAAGSAAAQTRLPAHGGRGGVPFEQSCPPGTFLRGLELRTGDDVDAARPVCDQQRDGGTLVTFGAIGPWRGGNGGAPRALLCPAPQPAVVGMRIGAEGDVTRIVNSVQLYCAPVLSSARPTEQDGSAASFFGPEIKSCGRFFPARFCIAPTNEFHACPPGSVGQGIHGRHGVWLDAVGLVCSQPALAGPLRRPLGRGGAPITPPQPMEACKATKRFQTQPPRQAILAIAMKQRCIESIPPDEQSRCGRAKRAVGTDQFEALFQLCLGSLPD